MEVKLMVEETLYQIMDHERYINLKGGLGSNYDGGPGNEGISNGSLNYMPKKPAFKFGSSPFGPINLDT